MTRKKKNSHKRKPKALSVPVLEKKLIDLFSKQVTTPFDAKGVIRKLKIANSVDSVQSCLEKLTEKGKLESTRRGKFKWNKSAKRNSSKGKTQGNSAVGVMDVTRSGSAYVVCEELKEVLDKDIFVPAHKSKGALHGDTVEVFWSLSRRGKPEGEVTQVVKRKTEQFIGTLVLSRKFSFVVPDNPSMQTDIVLDFNKLPKEAEDGAKVVVKVTKWHSDNKTNPEGEITTYFGTEGGNDIEMKSILIQKGFNLTFPPEVLRENATIDTEITQEEIGKRRDMRGITTFTIDPETAKDFDDALSIQLLDNGNYEIGVHIADVTHYVRPGTELDKEAAKRTTSVYLVDRVLPMLPEKLSNGVCSLRPEEEKLTFSAIFEMDMSGDVISEWFGKTVIYSDRRFSYEEAQERIETGEGDYVQELQLLNTFAHKLRKKRFSKGAINFESPEVRFKLDEEGKPLSVYLKSRKDAHMLVEDFMLLANKRVGALMAGLHEKLGFEWPMIYRIHDEPNMEKVEHFSTFSAQMGYPMKIKTPEQVKRAFSGMLKAAEGKPEAGILQQLAIRTMAKAVYSSKNIGHYGLGFLTYSHFTSPIRRYADVLAHRILFDYLTENNKRMNPNQLEESCQHISKKERDAMEAERESVKYKQAEFLETHINEVFEASISGITDHGVYAMLKENYCEGMIRYDKMYAAFDPDEHKFQIKSQEDSYKMGDTVWVRILGANKYKKQVDLEMLDPQMVDDLPKKEKKTEAPLIQEKKTKKEKLGLPEKKTSVKDIKKVHSDQLKAYKHLLKQTMQAYQESDIKSVGDKKQVKWNFEISPTAPLDGSVLMLELHPVAKKGMGYRAQKLFSQRIFQPTGPTKAFFTTYFPEAALSEAYFSPFRVLDAKQLSTKDLELSLTIFKDFVGQMRPTSIVAFSMTILAVLEEQGLLKGLVEEEIKADERTIVASKATLVWNELRIPMYFLPKPTSRLPKSLKEAAWEWAFGA